MKVNKIGIIGAMDEEIKLFLENLEETQKIEWNDFVFYLGKIFGLEAVVVKAGAGKTSAAMICQKMIDEFGPEAIIFTGVAGSLTSKTGIGDVVVSSDCVHHDLDASELGFVRGTIPFTDYRFFKADEELKNLALKTVLPNNKVLEGRILTGDQFLTKAKIKEFDYLEKDLAGEVVEMEGAAVAQVCVFNKIPFVVVRSVSDKADGQAAENFKEFLDKAARNSFEVVKNILVNINL